MPNFEYEEKRYAEGYTAVCGCDEAGRGPLCGPVVAAAVILPQGVEIEGLNDSKKLTEKKREALFDVIKEKAIAYAICEARPEEIDDINILNAMEHGINGNYLPVKADGDKIKTKGKVLASEEEFDTLYGQISDTLAVYGKKMKSGQAEAEPINLPKKNPCVYCKLYPICRNKNGGGKADAEDRK